MKIVAVARHITHGLHGRRSSKPQLFRRRQRQAEIDSLVIFRACTGGPGKHDLAAAASEQFEQMRIGFKTDRQNHPSLSWDTRCQHRRPRSPWSDPTAPGGPAGYWSGP